MLALIVILGFVGLMILLNKSGAFKSDDKMMDRLRKENSRRLTDPGYSSLNANIHHEDDTGNN